MLPLVPEHFTVPRELRTNEFLLRPLTMDDVDRDYEAVMSSIEHLQKQIPPSVFGHTWTDPNMTKRENQADLGWHEVEFKMRSSFTYTVVSPDGAVCLGCVYILPPRFTDGDAEVFLWVRESAYTNGLDDILFATVKTWISKEWPFKKVSFPFREDSKI